MTWSLRVLWLTACVATVVLPVPANAEDLLYSCYAGSMLDDITRGFYIENFSGSTLDRVAIDYMTSGEPGTYRTSLTAHQGTYDGPVIAWADNSFSETGAVVHYDFSNAPIEPSTTIAFVQELVSGPPGGVVYYNAGLCDVGDAECSSCPGIIETEDTTPPLSTFRRAGIHVTIWGRAETPADRSTWSTVKSLFR